MSDSGNKIGCGCGGGTVGLLGVAFIVLKLCGVIKWSWVWVLSPFWIEIAIVLAFLGAVVFGALSLASITCWRSKK